MNKVYNRIESITGNVITVRAKGIRNNELATVSTRFGKSLAEVNKIDGDLVSLQVFAGGKGVSTGDEVRFLGHEMQVSFSEDLFGRVFNGSGEPMDKAGSYGIQGYGAMFVSHLEGDYFSVMGLPLCPLCRMLRAFGVRILDVQEAQA